MENKKQQTEKYPKFLENKPCGQDLFAGKSHNTIAQNIANVLANNNAKIIGIDGGWGSGKSNMVDLIKDKLNELDKNKYHFFIYDAWGHQMDFQRRSILENLTGFLVDDAGILGKEKWNAKLLQLLSRKRSVGSKIVKELSAVAKVSAIVALTMPLLMLINGFIRNNTGKIVFWIAVFLIALTFLVIFQIKNMKKYGQHITLINIISELFLSYMDYTNEKSKDSIEQSMKYETIYDEEPSSRDFKNWMKEIDNDIKNHSLIIVFDNMDRLPREKVQELWSAIHTFFAEKKYNNIYVIVPFDREHIKSAFKSEDITNKQSNVDSIVCYGNDFINKTFDAVYRVSPPVMSDWKSYFAERWEEALGYKLDNKITQIYDLLSEIITPREIIAFINEFVSIKQISDSSIPDEYIALFIKGKDAISINPQKEILHPSYLGALDFMYKNKPELPQFISALYYQLSPENALDIIYTEHLKQALDNGDVEKIKLIQNKPHLLYHILENAITKVTNISNAVTSLDLCLSHDGNQQEQMIWDCLYEITKQESINDSLQEYQRILLKRITDKYEYLQTLVSGFVNTLDMDVLGYYNSIRQLSDDGFNPFVYLCEKYYSPDSFIYFVEQAKNDYQQYKIVCQQEQLDKYLSELDIDDLKTLGAIPYIKNDYNLSAYLTRLEVLVDLNANKKDSIKIIYDRIKELEKPITKKLTDTQVQSLFNTTKETEDFYYDLVCMRISRLKNFAPNLQATFNPILSRNEDELIEKVAERLEYYINYSDILLNTDNMNYPLYKDVANRLTEKSYGASIIDVVALFKKYEAIKQFFGIAPNTFIKRIDVCIKDVETNITIDNIKSIPVEFFKDIITIESDVTSYCIKVAKDYLDSKTKEEWKKSILASDYEFQLLMIIKPNSQACFDAFKELLVENVQANNTAFSKEKCSFLIELFEGNGREMLSAFNNVRDCLCSGTCSMTNDIFAFYGEWLLQYSKLEDKQSSLRTIFIPSVFDVNENVRLILGYKEKMKIIVEKAGDENKDFKDKVKSLLQSDYKNDKEFEIFAKSIGVEKPTLLDTFKEAIASD